MSCAAGSDSLEGGRLLIELGFDVNTRERTAPLHEAAMRGNLAIIELLLDHGANQTCATLATPRRRPDGPSTIVRACRDARGE